MADNGGGQSFLGFILGGLVVVVAIIGFMMYTGGHFGGASKTVNITVPSPTSTR